MVYTVDGVNYTRRTKILVTGAGSGAQTNFQIKLAAVWADAMQADWDDTRFTKADMQTLIDAWLESKVDSTSANIWVEFPNTPADGVEKTKAFMYFGNAGAASDWDGAATFLNFFDFDSYNNGNLSGQDGWSTSWDTHTIQDSVSHQGDKSVLGSGNRIDRRLISSQSLGAVTMWRRQSATDRFGYFILSDGSTWFPPGPSVGMADNGHFQYMNSAGSMTNLTTDTTYLADTWYKIEIIFDTTNDKYVSVKINDVEKLADVACSSIGNVDYLWLRSYIAPSVYYDTIYYRKYVSNPPTAAFGTEEHQRRTPMMM